MNDLAGSLVLGPLRVAFLGPLGTFTHQAVMAALPQFGGNSKTTGNETKTDLGNHDNPEIELIPVSGVHVALEKLRLGQADRAIVPIENSVEGGVSATLDAMAAGPAGTGLIIVREVLVPISFVLATAPNSKLKISEITRIGTHPHAWAQCVNWVNTTLGDITHIATSSTAAAAKILATRPEVDFDAALCPRQAAELYGLNILQQDIADDPSAQTRFVVVSPPGSIPAPTGADKTTVQVRLSHNQSGALLSMLEQFAVRGVNLSRIESRPAGKQFSVYAFSMDIEGHIDEERVRDALLGLHRTCSEVRFMGSYPRADRARQQVSPGNANADFVTARAWLKEVLDGRSV